jgi:hypothetical protein
MNPIEKQNLGMELEKFVDKYGLKMVVDMLSEVAHDKAVHIAENWQDVALAKVWTKRGNALNRVAGLFAENGEEAMRQVIVEYHSKETEE